VRQVATLTHGTDETARGERSEIGRLVVLFYRVTAQALRDERDLTPFAALLAERERAELDRAKSRPLVVAAWISRRIAEEARRVGTPEQRLLAMDANVTALIDCWGGCERIHRTPVPLAYAQHIKIFVTLWCFSVPFALVDTMRLYTPFAAALLAFALYGIDEIGVEIEDPFGHDPNDLAVDAIGDGIEASTAELLDVTNAARP
jgi:putative membrane protein